MKKITLLVCMLFVYAFAKCHAESVEVAYNEPNKLVCIEEVTLEPEFDLRFYQNIVNWFDFLFSNLIAGFFS